MQRVSLTSLGGCFRAERRDQQPHRPKLQSRSCLLRQLTRGILAAIVLTGAASAPLPAQGAAELAELVEGLGVSARVLVVAAHPDDEDTRIIAWLARGRHVETAYLSLTRGDGGQNLIGNELGEALGAIRTEELLAARRIDGARQFFTRAYDFGFSKSAEETFRHWPRDSVLGDVVTVVRAFRPHVIIAIFSGTPDDGHGHHQVSGILAREAYDVSADTVRFPAAKHGPAWTVPKFYRSRSYRNNEGATLRYNAGEYDPVLGRSYAEIAGASRSQHKSQGFGSLERKGVVWVSVRREATRVNEGTPAERETSLFDGIDTTWARLRPVLTHPTQRAALDSLPAAIAAVRRRFDPFHPGEAVAPLLVVRRHLHIVAQEGGRPGCWDGRAGAPAGGSPCRDAEQSSLQGLARVERAVLAALGVAVEATVDTALLARDASTTARVTVFNRGTQAIRVTRIGVVGRSAEPRVSLAPDSAWSGTVSVRGDSLTGPWWLRSPRSGDIYGQSVDGDDEERRGRGHIVLVELEVGAGEPLQTVVPVTNRFADPVRGEIQRPLAVAPGVALALDRTIEYAPANAPYNRPLRVTLTSAFTTPREVRVSLRLPRGLAADSAERLTTLPAGGTQTLTFYVRGRLAPGRDTIRAVATSGGETFTTGYTTIEYEHIRPLRLYREAAVAIQAVDVKLPARMSVAYVPGVGDNVPPMLQQLGVPLTVVEPSALGSADLSKYTAVVLGPRVFEAHPALAQQVPRLHAYARAGGTLVMQYQQYEITRPGMMPYPVTIARPHDRVTLEDAPVTVLDPRSPLLNAPNRITAADFGGWVQERALYMPRTFDPKYTPLLAMQDPEMAAPHRGALLVAPLGRGTLVYTTLSFFRQLPAGNPGAARLFVNILAAQPPAGDGGEVVP